MIQKTIHVLIAALLCVLIVLACYACLFIDTLTKTTAELPVTLDRAVAREGILTRAAASKQISASLKIVNTQITGLRSDVRGMETDLAGRSEKQVDQLRVDLTKQVGASLDKITQPVIDTTASVQELVVPMKNILNIASDNADLLGRCEFNPDCIANRTIGTMKAVEKTSVSVQKMADTIQQATPDTAAAVKSTSKDLSVIVNRFTKPVSFIKGVAGTAITWAGKFLGF